MKLLLVDDEEYSREGILSVVSWEELGIDQICIAENGREGLQIAAEFRPDIVLADIRMPRMDGLTMCHKIKELLPCCSIILISGYSDKEYLKSAIHLSAVNYLEKPFLPKELIDSIKQAIARNSLYTAASPRAQQENFLYEATVVTALMRRHSASDPLWTQISRCFPTLPINGIWRTILISFNDIPEHFPDPFYHMIRHHFPGSQSYFVLLGKKAENMIAFHLSCPEDTDLSMRIGSLSRHLKENLKGQYRYNLSLGSCVQGISLLFNSYETAMAGLQQCFFHGPDSIVIYASSDDPAVFSFHPEDIDLFEKLLKKGSFEEACSYIRTVCIQIRKYDHTLISTIKDFFSQLIRRLYYYSDSFILETSALSETLAESIHTIWDAQYLDDLEAYLCEKITALSMRIQTNSADTQDNPLPLKIRNYIDANYCDSALCLQSLADYFNITTSYICIVFKKKYQKTVNQYINEKRIEKSVEYLEHSNKKIKEISVLIGYPDPNYFIKVFKKITGITPKEYRRK